MLKWPYENAVNRLLGDGEGVMISLIGYYRYTSWFITSVFYLVGPPPSSLSIKGGLVLCLAIESYLFLKAYTAPEAEVATRKRLIMMETLGFAFFLVLTGGLESPFMWHAINPILLAATLKPGYFAWIMVAGFLGSASLLHQFNFYGEGEQFVSWGQASNLLVFVLITLVAKLYNVLIHRLSEQASVMEQHINHIESLYESVEMFSHRDDIGQIADLFAAYTRQLITATKVIVWIREEEAGTGQVHYRVRGPRHLFPQDSWEAHLRHLLAKRHWGTEIITQGFPVGRDDARGTLVAIRVTSDSKVMGLFSAFFAEDQPVEAGTRRTLKFLAKLCASVIERYALEQVAQDLIVTEEKDRIAREMHDTVTQQLFGVVYGLNSLITKKGWEEEDRDKVRLLQRMAQRGMRDLRTAIYSMRTLRSEPEPFITEVQQYLEEVANLNGVELDFHAEGRFNAISASMHQSLYRIIHEATANAIRHGQCNVLTLRIVGDDERVTLTIRDDGLGFDASADHGRRDSGLGLANMKEIVGKLGGTIKIESSFGKGTLVSCDIPSLETWKEGRTG